MLNLIESLGDWTRSIDNKDSTLVAYVDFQKAFNCVSLPKLIHKLKHIGIAGKLLDCISSFLIGRSSVLNLKTLSLMMLCLSAAFLKVAFWGRFFLSYIYK